MVAQGRWSLLANGIEPVVTLYEWDLPQKLQDLGGWTSLQTAEYFANFARLAFRLFGDRVKTWITISEPFNICEISYGQLSAPPLINSPGVGDYLCGKTVLIAHSKAYHIYDKEFRKRQKGKIGIVLDTFWPEPKTNRTEDIKAVDRVLQMRLGWFANPIFSKDGDYPEIMKKTIENRSVLENFAHSRLPPFTQTEIKDLKGSSDFFGLNHYYTSYFENLEHPIGESSFIKDAGISSSDFENSYGPKNRTVPWGFYRLLHWVANKYNNPLVYITEIGYHDDGRTDDTDRIVFHAKFLKALLHAIKEGCNVQRYTVWTFIDMFAWTLGYSYV
ncbi:hypothetical protein HHI36_016309 [Cryptolaemus montrouzieri]|uniref:Beta-glucosidase n=1 Tax=Cryptolaemus montrouzieri TaxID=559131 RepID=A0ABD2NJS0_9CUCU